MGRIYDYTGNPIDISDSRNELIPTELTYTVYRPTFWGEYRFCAITYDTKNSKFYMIGGSFERDGSSKLAKFTDIKNPLADITIANLQTGHSNDISYDPITDKILIAGGIAKNDGAGENQHSNTLFFVDPETMQVMSTKTFDKPVQGIEATGSGYYLWRSGSGIYNIDLYDRTFTTVVRSGTFTKESLMSFLNAKNSDTIYSQNIAYDKKNDRLYWCISFRDEYLTGYNNFHTAIMAEISTSDYSLVRTMTFDVSTTEEFQSATFVGDIMYAVSDGQYGIYRVYNPKISKTSFRKWIATNTDLNTLMSVGEYFSNGAANSATLIHSPTSDYGFSLNVSIQGSYGRRQDAVLNSGDRFSRIYLPPNDWGEWMQTYSVNNN